MYTNNVSNLKIANKTKNKSHISSETGSVTLFVVVTVMCFLSIFLLSYIKVHDKATAQRKEIDKIQEGYKVGSIEQIYDETVKKLGMFDYIAPHASIYEDYDPVSRKARVSVDVADYETDVDYVELPDGTKKYIEDEKNDNIKILVIDDRGGNQCIKLKEALQEFKNVTFNENITRSELLNSDYDIVISNTAFWSISETKANMLEAAFKAGKNVITIGNDNGSTKLYPIQVSTRVTETNVIGKSKLIDNEITDKITLNTEGSSDTMYVINQPIDGFQTWYTNQIVGIAEEYPAIGMYEENGARWFLSQMLETNLQNVFPYLIRKLTRVSTASYEIPGPGTYQFKIYDREGNCTIKTITTGNYNITYDYNEQILQNGDFSNGTTNWNGNTNITAIMDPDITYKGKPTVRLHTIEKSSWNALVNATIAKQYYTNTLYKMSMILYKDDTSSYGIYQNNFRMYIREFKGVDRIDKGAIGNVTLSKNKVWTTIEKEFTTAGDKWTEINLPFSGSDPVKASTVWLANVRVERIQKANAKYGNTIGTLPTPVRSGYTFKGWYTEPTGGRKINATDRAENRNVTYYAHW